MSADLSVKFDLPYDECDRQIRLSDQLLKANSQTNSETINSYLKFNLTEIYYLYTR